MAELRHDLLRQRWVIISDKGGKSPSDLKESAGQSSDEFKPGPCAFCPAFESENGHEIYAIRDGDQDDTPDWHVRVLENKYPAVSTGFEELLPSGEGTMYGACRLPGFGSHEVIVETPCHDLSLPELPTSHVAEVYKNRGNRVGASMSHSHSQLIALPVVSHNIQAELRGAQEFYDKNDKQCILCGVVKHETQKNRIRLIDENELFITIAPYAPSFPYETWLVPKHHSSNFETVSEDEIQSMAEMLKLTSRKLDLAFGCPPYNYTLHTAPLG